MIENSVLYHTKGRLFRMIALAVASAVILLSAMAVYHTYISLGALGEDISATLAQGQKNIESILDANHSALSESVTKAEKSSREQLSGFLGVRLKSETQVIQNTLHTSLSEGAGTLAVLLANISRDAILARNYAQLVSYAKIASSQENIVYAVFFRPDGKPFTRYVNRRDPQVKALMEKGSGRTGLDKLMSAAAGDTAVVQIEKDILYEGKALGRVALGVSMLKMNQATSAMAGRMDQLISNSSAKVTQVLETEGKALAENLSRNFADIRAQNAQSGSATLETIEQSAGSLLRWQIIVSAGFGLLIMGALCWFLLVKVIVPIRQLTRTMEDIASGEGDLTRRLPQDTKDEIGQLGCAFNHFVAKTQDTIARAGDSVSRLATAAEDLSRVASENSQGMNAQRDETQQVATAITEMASTVQEVANSAEKAAAAARAANAEAAGGRKVVSETVSVIDTLAAEVEQASEVINRLEEDSTAIGSVLDVIRNIADQTNLLALNAAIEAARAGEQGRGFAVVAEEVRSLASRTQESTQEIQTMIERVQTRTKEAVQVMTAGVTTTRDTVDRAARAGEALDNIVDMVGTINDMNTQIAGASEEQTVVAANIDQSVVHIAELSDGITQGTQQLATSSQGLAQLGEELQQLVGRFKV